MRSSGLTWRGGFEMARKIRLTPRAVGGLVAVAAVMLPAAAVLMGCGGGGGGVTSPTSRPGQPTIPSSSEFVALLPVAQQSATLVGSQACAQCHGGSPAGRLDASLPPLTDVHTTFSATTHARVGVGCESCHGPGSAHVAANGDRNTILTFPNSLSPVVCAQCHAGIHQEWTLSKHDDKVTAPIQSGSTTCLRCHSSRFRVEVIEKGYPAGNTQRFGDEAHTAGCAVCHNPHQQTGNLNDDSKEVQLRHMVFNTDTSPVAPGASVESYTRFNHACAECHNGRGANGSDTQLQRDTRPNMHDSNQYNMLAGIGGADEGNPIRSQAHFNAPGQCSTCHMFDGEGRHTFVVKLDNCVPCHTTTDAAARRNAIRGEIESRLLVLRNRMERWATTTFGNKEFWDYPTVLSEENLTAPNQTQIPIQVKRARHNYYFVLRDASLGTHNGTYARNLLDVASRNLDQLGPAAASVRAGSVSTSGGRAILEADRRRASRADAHGWEP
jgi:hypothetical protein